MMMMIFLWLFVILLNLSWSFYIMLICLAFMLIMMYFPLYYEYSVNFFFMDMFSFSLFVLSLFLSVLMVMSMYNYYNMSKIYLLLMINSLLLFLMLSFSSSNLLMFYFFFECSLIPTFLLILGWGYQPERIQASVYFMFYTLFASLPLLLVLLYLLSSLGSASFFSFSHFMVEKNLLFLLVTLFSFLAFLIKLPMFLFHLWLPKAHVEAPVAGSMILAGVLLKLGGFGIIRMSLFTPFSLVSLSPYIYSLSLVGMSFVGLVCCRMNDLKALVAYSSVAHMGLVISGIMSFISTGYTGGLLMMVGHGFSSSGLFCIVNIYYERSSTRSMYLNKSLSLIFPSMALFMFLICCSNISAPPTVNLLSEVLLMYSVMDFSYHMMVVFPLGTFLGAVFTFFLFSFTQHGKCFSLMNSLMTMNSREYHMMVMHLIPINLLVVFTYYYFL